MKRVIHWLRRDLRLSAENIHAPRRVTLEGYARGYASRLVMDEEQRSAW